MMTETHPLDALAPRGYATVREWFEERFIPEPNSGCWLWTRSTSPGPKPPKPKAILGGRAFIGSRLAFLIYRGPIPEGMLVCHRCDLPLCVNPDHLWLGTNADNLADMKAKGRSAYGERCAQSKLTISDVQEIRSYSLGSVEAAKKFGVTKRTINDVRARKTWTFI